MRSFCHRFFCQALAVLVLTAGRAAQAGQPPIILFVFSDDHANQAIGAYGFGLKKTPNIDRIGAAGMRFNRCLTTRPKIRRKA
jgi:hypothetical protein